MIEAVQADLKANAHNIAAIAINQEGIIRTRGIEEIDGRLTLVGEGGTIKITGKMSAKNSDGTGGKIHVLGKYPQLLENAKIDVSGDFGGGEVLFGGDYRGENPDVLNATAVFMSKDASVDVSAKIEGDAGRAIFWG